MSFPSDSTWVMTISGGDTFALYVRDALGIDTPTATSIPPLTPAVPRVDFDVPPSFGAEWDRWWVHTLGEGRLSGGIDDLPGRWPTGLPAGLRGAYSDWHDPRTPEATSRRDDARTNLGDSLRELVSELKEELGHEPVFTLEMIQIPVKGQFWRRLNTDTVLVSEELLLSRNIIAPLETVIRELAGAD